MTYRTFLLAACAGTGLLVAASSMAMPFSAFEPNTPSTITLVDDDDDDNHRAGQRHGSEDDDDREISNDSDDDDDDDDCGDRLGGRQKQNDAAPANGLFTPGSKPAVQVN